MNISALVELPAFIGIFFLMVSIIGLVALILPLTNTSTPLHKLIAQYRNGEEKNTAFQGPIGLILFMLKTGISLLLGGLILIGAYRLLN